MKSWRNINKSWQKFFLVIISFYYGLFITDVYAVEIDNEITNYNETIIQDVIVDEVIISNTIEETNEIINTEEAIDNKEEIDTNTELNEDESVDNSIDEDILVEEKTKEEIFTNYSVNMIFDKDIVTIKGNILENSITVNDILNNINIVELNKEILVEKIGVTNEEDIWLNNEDYVTNLCHIVFISNEFVSRYQVKFLGDLNQDNVVNENDVETGINNFFKETIVDDEIESIPIIEDITKDVSYIDAVIDNKSFEVETPVIEDVLNVSLESIDNVDKLVDDEFLVEVKIDGFINNYMNTISGKIVYDNDVLELENVYVLVDGKVIGKVLDNKFIYVLDNYQNNGTLLIMIFKGINCGTTDIYLEQLKVMMNGSSLSILNENKLTLTINEYGKGGDVELTPGTNPPDNDQSNDLVTDVTSPSQEESIKFTPTVNNNVSNKEETVITLSHDNYIKNIEIVGYDILFDKDVSNYSIEVDNDVKALNLNVVLNNDKASYFITGNGQFKEGINQVILTVLAEDGSSRDYIIEVNKKESVDDINDTPKDNEFSNDNMRLYEFIILILLIITVAMIIYKLLKKDD